MADKNITSRRTHRIRTRLAAAHGVEWELLQTFLGFAFTVQQEALKSKVLKEKRSDSLAEGLHPAFERIAIAARNLTDATGAALALGGEDAMVCVARSGESAPPVSARFDAKSGLSGECIRTGETTVCVNAAADPRVNYQACRALHVSSMLYFPLRSTQGKMIGMLGVFSSKPRQFSQRDVSCLRFIEGLVQESLGRTAADPDPATLGVLLQQADFAEPEETFEAEMKPAVTAPIAMTPAPPKISPIMTQATVAPRAVVQEPRFTPKAQTARALAVIPEAVTPAPRPVLVSRPVVAVPPKPELRPAPKPEPIFVGRVVDESVQDSEPDLNIDPEIAGEAQRRSRIPAMLILLVAALVAIAAWNYNRFFGTQHFPATATPIPKSENDLPAVPAPESSADEAQAGSTEQELTSMVSLRSGDEVATVTIMLPQVIKYEGYQLTNPDRVYFDLHGAKLTDAKGNVFPSSEGLISKVRLSDYGAGITRVVFDLRGPATFEAKLADKPQRLVIELHRTGTAGKVQESVPAVPTKMTIVVDPGHGGKDLGTVSPSGLQEKDLTLDVAQRLGALLRRQLGANVIFTRDRDYFVTLDERVAIANQAHADFMISIHGNSSTLQSVRGVETYYFGQPDKPGAMPAEETETARAFAADVHRALIKGLADPQQPMRDRGVKQASFVVLRGAQMPAALAEVSFVSNRNDAPRLESPEYREQIARALYRGIANYVNHQMPHQTSSLDDGLHRAPVTP